MEQSCRLRLYPNQRQEELIQKTFGCSRFVYNHFLSERIRIYRETGKSVSFFDQNKTLTVLKQQYPWLQEPDKHALQNALRNLDRAYKNFFRRTKQGKKPGFPNYKSRKHCKKSYKTNGIIKVLDHAVQVPKLGKIKCCVSRSITGRILSAVISQSASGKYYISIGYTDVNFPALQQTGKTIGIDFGSKRLAILSDGTEYENHRYLRRSQKKLAKLQRQLSRKTKGSNRYEKARIKLARCHEHIAAQRQDSLQKMTTELIRKYDIIAIEDLVVSNMIKNHSLAKSIADASWAETRRMLEYKADWYGKTIIVIDRFFPSSQLCSCCGVKWPGIRDLKIRQWICPACHAVHDRDVNAAKNILNEGIRMVSVLT